MGRDYFVHVKNMVLGKRQNYFDSGNVGPFLEFEISMETSMQGDSGF